MRRIFFLFTLFTASSLTPLLAFQDKNDVQTSDTTAFHVKFLSDIDPVYQRLESCQKLSYAVHPSSYRWTGRPDQVRNLRRIMKYFGGDHNTTDFTKIIDSISLPTRYEDPLNRFIILGLQQKVEKEITLDSLHIKTPSIGTLALADLNAQSFSYGQDSALIVFNGGIFNFCHEMTKIGLSTVVIDSTGIAYGPKIFDSVCTDSFLVRYSRAIEDYINVRYIATRYRSDTDVISETLLYHLVECMEFFSLAHEYGHLLLHHIPSGKETLQFRGESTASQPKNPLMIDEHSWTQEIEADIVGEMLLNGFIDRLRKDKGKQQDYFPFLYQAPAFFFSLSSVAGEAAQLYENKTKPVPKSDSQRILQFAVTLAEKAFNTVSGALVQKKIKVDSTQSKYDDTAFSIMDAAGIHHPPDWVRAKLLTAIIRELHPPKDDTEGFEDLNLNIILNMNEIWRKVRPLWIQVLQSSRQKTTMR